MSIKRSWFNLDLVNNRSSFLEKSYTAWVQSLVRSFLHTQDAVSRAYDVVGFVKSQITMHKPGAMSMFKELFLDTGKVTIHIKLAE